jgi:fluoride exporter
MAVLLQSKTIQTFLLLSAGAVIGTNLRYWLGVYSAHRFGVLFPWGTLFINLTGSFILAFFLTFITERSYLDPRWVVFFGVGLLGSYTTFSTYSYEATALIVDGRGLVGVVYLFGSALLGAAAGLFGVVLARVL